jgi:hypothetical protein
MAVCLAKLDRTLASNSGSLGSNLGILKLESGGLFELAHGLNVLSGGFQSSLPVLD